jgi:hypothetical protein
VLAHRPVRRSRLECLGALLSGSHGMVFWMDLPQLPGGYLPRRDRHRPTRALTGVPGGNGSARWAVATPKSPPASPLLSRRRCRRLEGSPHGVDQVPVRTVVAVRGARGVHDRPYAFDRLLDAFRPQKVVPPCTGCHRGSHVSSGSRTALRPRRRASRRTRCLFSVPVPPVTRIGRAGMGADESRTVIGHIPGAHRSYG